MDKLLQELITVENQVAKVEEQKEALLVINQIFEQIEALDNEVDRLNGIKDNIREQMTSAFRENYDGTNDVFEMEGVRIKYTPPTTRKSVDTTILKATYPDVYKKVLKESPVKDKVTITFKGKKEK